MSAEEETVTAGQPTRFPHTRAEALQAWKKFRPRIHTEKLPWQLGADFFCRHLLDADPAVNTLSWRWVAGLQTQGKTYLTRRSNLERYVEPTLLLEHSGGLEKLEDKLAQLLRVDDTGTHRIEVPADADKTALPDNLPAQIGLWVHADDLCVKSAASLRGLRPQTIFAGLDTGILQAEQLKRSTPRALGSEPAGRLGTSGSTSGLIFTSAALCPAGRMTAPGRNL